MERFFKEGDHIADETMAQKGILSAGTINSRSDIGYWIRCVSGGSAVIRSENAISAQDALDILKKDK